MIDLTNKNVLITGGSRGIGAACVDLFIKANANVAFTYQKNIKSSEQIIYKYRTKNKIISYQMRADDENSVINTVQNIEKNLGGIDILVNNAGVWKYGAADSMSLEDWSETININLTGVFLITKHVLKVMKKNNFGRIIIITSTAGQRGEAFHSHYAASKGGLISYTKSLAAEFGQYNITTNSVAPGWVDTDMTHDILLSERGKAVAAQSPMNRVAQPEELAHAVILLASPGNEYMTGCIIDINGASYLRT